MNRRQWLRATALAGLAASSIPNSAGAADGRSNSLEEPAPGPSAGRWKVGVLNRAWADWDLGDALKGAREAGFSSFGLIAAQKKDLLIGGNATPRSLDSVKRQIGDAGLELVVTALRFQEDAPLP